VIGTVLLITSKEPYEERQRWEKITRTAQGNSSGGKQKIARFLQVCVKVIPTYSGKKKVIRSFHMFDEIFNVQSF